MDIPRPDNFNETYLYEGMLPTATPRMVSAAELPADKTCPQS